MIKQVVVLQDERMIIKEIERQTQRVSTMAGAAVGSYAAMHASPDSLSMPPVPSSPPLSSLPPSLDVAQDNEDDAQDTVAVAPDAIVSLSEVARAAALKAERALIEQTLQQVQWNRRNAAALLGVSYKTLLNKIKECGISR
ncbi:MAG: helix-turn-helix domain-containing protein [Gemmatimonadaceae bacterium]